MIVKCGLANKFLKSIFHAFQLTRQQWRVFHLFCHIYMSDFPIIENEGILLVDSRLVAERLGIEHESFMETIYAYQSQI
ncbi:hypothetical protein, partial [Floridanema evergladense]